jgi:hypothetical protein
VAYLWVEDEKEAGQTEDDVIRRNGWNTEFCLNGSLGMNVSTAVCVKSGKKAIKKVNELLTPEVRSKNAKKAQINRRNRNPDEYFGHQRSAALKGASKIFYMCLETSYISNSTGLGQYQKKRGINPKKRVKMSSEEMAMILLWGNPPWWDSEIVRSKGWYVNKDGERMMAKEPPGEGWQPGMIWRGL